MGPKLRSVTTSITEQQVLQLATGKKKKKTWSVPCAKKGILANCPLPGKHYDRDAGRQDAVRLSLTGGGD